MGLNLMLLYPDIYQFINEYIYVYVHMCNIYIQMCNIYMYIYKYVYKNTVRV